MNEEIKYDFTNMRSEHCGKGGFSDNEIEDLLPKLKRVKAELMGRKKSCELEFACLPQALTNIGIIKDKAKQLSEKFDTMVVVGIGGSDLGTRTSYQALGSKNYNSLKFLGNTTDPHELKTFLSDADFSRLCFNFVSRSGETIEVLSAFSFLRDKIKTEQIVVTTGKSGFLRKEAQVNGYFLFEEPANVSDRFSVLSVVSLFPMAFIGTDIGMLLSGASVLANMIDETSVREDPMLLFSVVNYLGLTQRSQSIGVLMSYAARLEYFGNWYRQLMAESLGKDGKGITPVNLNGPSDQHSFLQLLLDGPKDKIVNFIKVENFEDDYEIPTFKNINGRTFSEVLNAEYEATRGSLAKSGVPSGTIFVPTLNEYFLGQLFYFFEVAVSYLGLLLDVDPYSQPAVEENKLTIEKFLS